jgi:hypothetical protein
MPVAAIYGLGLAATKLAERAAMDFAVRPAPLATEPMRSTTSAVFKGSAAFDFERKVDQSVPAVLLQGFGGYDYLTEPGYS